MLQVIVSSVAIIQSTAWQKYLLAHPYLPLVKTHARPGAAEEFVLKETYVKHRLCICHNAVSFPFILKLNLKCFRRYENSVKITQNQ